MAKKKTAKKTASTKKTGLKKATSPAPEATPVADPCAAGHQWDTDKDGVEHCTVCLADKKVVETAEKKKETKAAKPKKAKPAKAEGKLSALDAAAQVLATSAEPLNTKQMIEQMTAKGLWTSPGGATPHATLYSAILREIQVKGKEARFKKTERGHFAANG
jgi:conjugal transfer/entry exclusion protein